MNRITVRCFDDLHCHFRLEPLLSEVLPFTAAYAGRGLVMPNTKPCAILNAQDVKWYRGEIQRALDIPSLRNRKNTFVPLMTIEIRDDTTPSMVDGAWCAGAVAGKVYPRGIYSDEGLSDFFSPPIMETFRAMQDPGMLLLLHGELEGERILINEQEHAFLPTLSRLADAFPKLKIVLEHVSTREGVELVKQLGENVAATITAHHLCTTLNSVLKHGIHPHNMCNPVPKRI